MTIHKIYLVDKTRLALLTACLSGRKLIILDEPTSGLDYKRMNDISEIIKDIQNISFCPNNS